MINENDYRALEEDQKQNIKSFNLETFDSEVNNQDELILYEITSMDIKTCSQKQEYTWVHIWIPYCGAEQCKSINYYQEAENTFKSNDLKVLLVSNSYDFKTIKSRLEHSNYTKPIFVLKDSYFGHKTKKTGIKLFDDLKQDSSLQSDYGFGDYLYKDTVLIFAGNLEIETVDSLINDISLKN